MAAVITLLIVVILSLVVTKVGGVALSLTGLSREAARFQARSAFTGAGFTTSESEAVVDHPQRRRIISALIVLGNAGLASAVATLLLTFSGGQDTGATVTRGITIGIAGALLIAAGRSQLVDRWLTRVIRRVLNRTTDLDVRDYAGLLRMRDGFAIAELEVHDDDWITGRTLIDLDLPSEGVLVLGIHRADGTWIGAPAGNDELREGDVAVLYGPRETLGELDLRRQGRRGDDAHSESSAAFEDYKGEQEARAQAAEGGPAEQAHAERASQAREEVAREAERRESAARRSEEEVGG